MKQITRRTALLSAMAAPWAAQRAAAQQDYPNRPIRLIVPPSDIPDSHPGALVADRGGRRAQAEPVLYDFRRPIQLSREHSRSWATSSSTTR